MSNKSTGERLVFPPFAFYIIIEIIPHGDTEESPMKLNQLLRHMESTTGASIFLHILHPAFLDCEALHLAPDQYIHHGPFCRAMKLSGQFSECCASKDKTVWDAREGKVFERICPFGLWELVTPFFHREDLAAVIYMGHFRKENGGGNGNTKREGKGNAGGTFPGGTEGIHVPLLTEELRQRLYEYSRFLTEFLRLEIDLWILSGGMNGKKRGENYYCECTRRFIDCNFTENVSMTELAETLRVHPGYLGELLKKHCGKSFRRMLAERRIHESQVYLRRHRHLSIAQIAGLCGFDDSNYFSQVFHRITGCTPREYQKFTPETGASPPGEGTGRTCQT